MLSYNPLCKNPDHLHEPKPPRTENKNCYPKDWFPVAAFSNGQQIVVIGQPICTDDDEADFERHNCDDMGCGWDHVMARFDCVLVKEEVKI